MVNQPSQRHSRPNSQLPFRSPIQQTQLRHSTDVDDMTRRLLQPLHVGVEVSSSGDVRRVQPVSGLDPNRLVYRGGEAGCESGQAQHDQAVGTAVERGVALPSPPSAGVRTQTGSGQMMCGVELGPNRGSAPLALACSALYTLGGLIGTSSTLTPTAS